MGDVRNILFIMCDQLRADYLGCTGHPSIKTPHIDALAKRGVIFNRAYCQAPVCGPSRMSFYTGRYMRSHGSTYNGVPLRIGEPTLGDYMRASGVETGLIGKTHMAADHAGMTRLGIDPASQDGILASQCGFAPWERDDGLHPDKSVDPNLAYNTYLREQGYTGENPWHSVANSADGPDGDIKSGWLLRNAHLPARVDKAHSETAYMTGRAIEKITALGETPWCLHLSYIKPHWPYMAPTPYHNMYSASDVIPANRSEAEKQNAHPVIKAFRQHEEAVNFSKNEIRQHVIPAYMGLISEIDDQIGRLMRFLQNQGRLDDTLIVFTSDHGDYLGDHWLGEKEMFHDCAARIPMIVVDPAQEADQTRGTIDNRLVESIDLVPTFTDAIAANTYDHVLEGRSLLPLLRNRMSEPWRTYAISEADYGFRMARRTLGLPPGQTRAFMVATERWKYVSFLGFPPLLFDLKNDPEERQNLGPSPDHDGIRKEMENLLSNWFKSAKIRATTSNEIVEERTDNHKAKGIFFGEW